MMDEGCLLPPPKGLLRKKIKLRNTPQGTDVTVEDSFAPLGESHGKGTTNTTQHTTHNGRTSRLLDQIGPVGRYGENGLGQVVIQFLKSRIRETLNLSTDAHSSTDTIFCFVLAVQIFVGVSPRNFLGVVSKTLVYLLFFAGLLFHSGR